MKGYLTTTQVSKVLGVAPNTLRNWRSMGRGPAYYKIRDTQGKATIPVVRYKKTDVDKFKKLFMQKKRIEPKAN